jgi:hypothetical protein
MTIINHRLVTHRGINFGENKDRSDRRLLTTVGDHLIAPGFTTGKQIETFGDQRRSARGPWP